MLLLINGLFVWLTSMKVVIKGLHFVGIARLKTSFSIRFVSGCSCVQMSQYDIKLYIRTRISVDSINAILVKESLLISSMLKDTYWIFQFQRRILFIFVPQNIHYCISFEDAERKFNHLHTSFLSQCIWVIPWDW